MKLANPNEGQPFQRVIKDANDRPLWGIRGENTPEEEIVHIPTGKSNQQYWKPEVVMNPEGCDHKFRIYDIGRREIECSKCKFATNFVPGINYAEENGVAKMRIESTWYEISL